MCEAEFKCRKVELEKGEMVIPLFDYVAHYSVAKQGDADAKTTANKEPDDLEMIGGTSEDDFSEAIALVRFELNPKIPLTM